MYAVRDSTSVKGRNRMSVIQDIITRCESAADRGHQVSAYQEHVHNLQALDAICDQLTRIADAPEDRNTRDGVVIDHHDAGGR